MMAKGRCFRTIFAAVLAGVASGIAASVADAAPDGECLWAGSRYAQSISVVAGGWSYTCGTATTGTPRWGRGPWVGGPSTVANPGAESNPAGKFSVGARQPGTDYVNYCIGTELVEGRDAVFEAVSDGKGFTFWKFVEPIDQWHFDDGTGPPPSEASSSLCLPEPPLATP